MFRTNYCCFSWLTISSGCFNPDLSFVCSFWKTTTTVEDQDTSNIYFRWNEDAINCIQVKRHICVFNSGFLTIRSPAIFRDDFSLYSHNKQMMLTMFLLYFKIASVMIKRVMPQRLWHIKAATQQHDLATFTPLMEHSFLVYECLSIVRPFPITRRQSSQCFTIGNAQSILYGLSQQRTF